MIRQETLFKVNKDHFGQKHCMTLIHNKKKGIRCCILGTRSTYSPVNFNRHSNIYSNISYENYKNVIRQETLFKVNKDHFGQKHCMTLIHNKKKGIRCCILGTRSTYSPVNFNWELVDRNLFLHFLNH